MNEEALEIQDQGQVEEDMLMTPEEMALLKKLQAKRKQQQKAMSGVKETLFQDLTMGFGEPMSMIKKDITTISTKEEYADGNVYSITFGSDEEVESSIDPKELAASILDEHLSKIEAIMGISNSIKLPGTFEGKKVFWQIRKPKAT